MNPEQKSVTLAMLVIFAALGVKHRWFGRALGWARNPTLPAGDTGKSVTGFQDWEAALIWYLAAMIIADTTIAPVAPPLTWAIAFVAGARALGDVQSQGQGVLENAQGSSNLSQGSPASAGQPIGKPGAAAGGQSF